MFLLFSIVHQLFYSFIKIGKIFFQIHETLRHFLLSSDSCSCKQMNLGKEFGPDFDFWSEYLLDEYIMWKKHIEQHERNVAKEKWRP